MLERVDGWCLWLLYRSHSTWRFCQRSMTWTFTSHQTRRKFSVLRPTASSASGFDNVIFLSLSLFAFFRFCEDPDSQRIRSAGRNLLHVPCHRLSTYGRRRAFAIAGPSVWNSLPDPVRNPNSTETALRHLSKEIFVGTVVAHLAHQGPSPVMRYRNWHIAIAIDIDIEI